MYLQRDSFMQNRLNFIVDTKSLKNLKDLISLKISTFSLSNILYFLYTLCSYLLNY